MEPKSFSTGFITDIINNRIIICTSYHSLVIDPSNSDSVFYNSFACDVTGVYEKGSREKNKRPISASIKVLGVDKAADLAVLYSIKPCEETKFNKMGYNFSSRNSVLEFAKEQTLVGTKVYSLVNIYGTNISMLSGCMSDSNITIHTEALDYTNNVQQQVTDLACQTGSSGAPVIILDSKGKKGLVCGIVQWVKLENTYTGGLNQFSLTNIYQKIIQLNVTNSVLNEIRTDFNGKTGKGYLGVISYVYFNSTILAGLTKNFPIFANSVYSNIVQGIAVTKYSKTDLSIENSRLFNAINIDAKSYQTQDIKCEKISNTSIAYNDIILEINGSPIGDTEFDHKMSQFSYYNAGRFAFVKVLRISATEPPEILYFKAICDEYPSSSEIVSKTSDIKLIEWIKNADGSSFWREPPPWDSSAGGCTIL